MKKVMSIGMALVFVFFVAPAMATDICPLKNTLSDAETSVIQMTNSELSAVRGGWVWTFKSININEPSVSSPVSAEAISIGSGQVNNISVNNGTEPPLKYNSQTNGGYGYRKVIIGFRPLRVVEQDPAP